MKRRIISRNRALRILRGAATKYLYRIVLNLTDAQWERMQLAHQDQLIDALTSTLSDPQGETAETHRETTTTATTRELTTIHEVDHV